MKCSLVFLALIGAALSAPQSLYGAGYGVSSIKSPVYTINNLQRGYGIESSGVLPATLRSGSVYSSHLASHSDAIAAQQAAAHLEAQRSSGLLATQRLAVDQTAAHRAVAEQVAAQRLVADQYSAHRLAAAPLVAHRAAPHIVAAQRSVVDPMIAQRVAVQPVMAHRSSYGAHLDAAHLGGASYGLGVRSGLQGANILRQSHDSSEDGSAYNFGFESDNGIAVQAQGTVRSFGPKPDDVIQSVTGSYSYVGDDGQTYTVNYVADENGFQPQGAHLHPVPEEIQRSIQFNLAHPQQHSQYPEILVQKK